MAGIGKTYIIQKVRSFSCSPVDLEKHSLKIGVNIIQSLSIVPNKIANTHVLVMHPKIS